MLVVIVCSFSYISEYYLSLGSQPGFDDAYSSRSVGLTTAQLIPFLQLQHGKSYYATVRAIDSVGHSSAFYSSNVVIDLTPPSMGNMWSSLDYDAVWQASTDQIAIRWFNTFDNESGIVQYESALSSISLYSTVFDLQDWMLIRDSTLTDHTLFTGLELLHGHTYYPRLRATNGAGLTATMNGQGQHQATQHTQQINDMRSLLIVSHCVITFFCPCVCLLCVCCHVCV